MAIKINSKDDQNEVQYPFPEAYLKVDTVWTKTLGPEKQRVQIDFQIFASETSRRKNGYTVDKRKVLIAFEDLKPFFLDFSTDGMKAAAYKYLKSLAEFSAGEDC